MIPEKRDPEVVKTLMFRASITGQPVELREDEIEEFEQDPFRLMVKALSDRIQGQL